MPDTPLNPDAQTRRDIMAGLIGAWIDEWEDGKADTSHVATHIANRLAENGVTTLAAAHLDVDGLARVIMHTRLPYGGAGEYVKLDANAAHAVIELLKPHLAALPATQTEVSSVESIPAKMRMLMWEGGEFEVGEIPDGFVLVGFEMETDRAWSMADKVTINIERREVNDAT